MLGRPGGRERRATYNLAQGRKDGLGDNLAIVPRCQIPLASAVLRVPVTEAKLVHGVMVKEPVKHESRVAVVGLVRHVVEPGNLLGAGKENAPSPRGLFQTAGLMATTRRPWRDAIGAHFKGVEQQARSDGLEFLLAREVTDADIFEMVDGNLKGRDGPAVVHHGGLFIAEELVSEGGKGMPSGYRWRQLVTDRHSDEQGVELPHAIAAGGDETRGLYSVCRMLEHGRQTWVSEPAYHRYLEAGRADGCS